jgi:ACS family pantothenate transporter-like MFS transporter
MQYIIGSWYQKGELGKRSCIFHASSAVGSMFSAYLMAAVYHLDGIYGFKGWQWLFIINTVVSLPIALSGFFFLPDVPEITRAWYFTPSEIVLAQKRMQAEGRANRAPYTRNKAKRIFSSWHIYLFTLLYTVYINGGGVSAQPAFAIWLKEQGYSIPQVNIYPTLTTGVQIITTLIYAWTSDTILQGERWSPIIFSGVMIIIVNISLTIWDIPTAWKWACFILAGCSSGISGLIYAWTHEICAEDNEERALVVGSMNEMANMVQAWLPLLIWQQAEAPEYPKGYPVSVGIAVAMIAIAMTIRHLQRRDLALRQLRLE